MTPGYHRPTVLKIKLENITKNVSNHKKMLNNEKIFAVIKANAYGHGAIPVAKAALEGGAEGFCVALLDEALELRRHGFLEPILVLNMVDALYLPLAAENNISITCGNEEWLEEALHFLKNNPLNNPVKLHLKIDSGMGRIGFFTKESLQEAYEKIQQAPRLFLEGIFTHFSTADEKDETYFNEQLEKFTQLLDVLPELPEYVHSSNSATSLWHKAGVGNLVRLGISMYGLNPSGKTLPLPFPLAPALSLESSLIQVKKVPKGTGVGYGKTYVTKKEEWIGTVPIGYADGWQRKMSGFSVLVKGKKCEIVGRVCMDQCMIRLPEEVSLGEKVTLIGKNSGEEITLQEVADHLETIHYEVACLLSDRLNRVYE